MSPVDPYEVVHDVVVVGGGLGGLAAAVCASELGLRAIVLEKGRGEDYPCNTRYSGGAFHVAQLDLWRPPGELRAAIDHATGAYCGPDLPQLVASEAANAATWLRERGAEFDTVGPLEWQRNVLAPVGFRQSSLNWRERGPDLFLRGLLRRLRDGGGSLLEGHEVVDLIVESGRVVGVRAVAGDGERELRAAVVVLADGGFQANPELVARHVCRSPEKILMRGAPSGVGSGLRMAADAGATLASLDHFYGHLLSRDALVDDRLWPYPLLDEVATAGILVTSDGRRPFDEGAGGIALANRVVSLEDPLSSFVVADERIWQGPARDGLLPVNPTLPEMGGTLYRADSVQDAAREAGIDPDALVRTLQEYNEAVRARRADGLDVPRTASSHELLPIEHGPFYCIPACVGITYTWGGPVIDRHARVLDQEGAPIPALYAVGATSGGLEGGDRCGYVGGLIKATVTGLAAAGHIAGTTP